jgi:hypothetical protein
MQCPACGGELVELERRGVRIDACRQCRAYGWIAWSSSASGSGCRGRGVRRGSFLDDLFD